MKNGLLPRPYINWSFWPDNKTPVYFFKHLSSTVCELKSEKSWEERNDKVRTIFENLKYSITRLLQTALDQPNLLIFTGVCYASSEKCQKSVTYYLYGPLVPKIRYPEMYCMRHTPAGISILLNPKF